MRAYRGKAIGRKFNRLTVQAASECSAKGLWQFTCTCECGNTRQVTLGNLKSGAVKECKRCSKISSAAHNKAVGKCIGDLAKTHGLTNTTCYNSWTCLRSRCDNRNGSAYPRYGGRGIKYSKDWLTFENFLADMGSTWFKGATIDRIDNDGDYTKDNCQWLTRTDHAIKSNKERAII